MCTLIVDGQTLLDFFTDRERDVIPACKIYVADLTVAVAIRIFKNFLRPNSAEEVLLAGLGNCL